MENFIRKTSTNKRRDKTNRPFRRNQMGSASKSNAFDFDASASERYRAVHVSASGDILGNPPYNFSRP